MRVEGGRLPTGPVSLISNERNRPTAPINLLTSAEDGRIVLNMNTAKHWEIKKISHSSQNGAVYLEGVNHFDGSSICWHVDFKYGTNSEYDFSGAVVADERAAKHLARWDVTVGA